MKSFELEQVKEVHVLGLLDFELIVDAHQDGRAWAVVLSGSNADSVAVRSDGEVARVQGLDDVSPRTKRAMSMSGTFVTGNLPIPLIAVPKRPLRIRYGGVGEPAVTIEVSLPPGQRIVLRGAFGTVNTAAPSVRTSEPHGNYVPAASRERARKLLAQARDARRNGSLTAAIRAHEKEEEARVLLEGENKSASG
ncbi:MAG TPA: hypothetical protein VF701_19275 [Thermoanaerobaculia bacterium]